MHPVRRDGRTEPRVLYWFRSPPYVKVGRAAIDPEAMRHLESEYPDISFDWDKILREPPQQMPEALAVRRREHREAREARRRRKRPDEPAMSEGAGIAATPEGGRDDAAASRPEAPANDFPGIPEEPVADTPEWDEPPEAPARLPQRAHAHAPAIEAWPASELLGVDGAARLLNRFVVLMQRIERQPDGDARERLRAEARALDPQSWGDAETVRSALETYEARYETLRAQVGSGGRRRKRRRRGGQQPSSQPPAGDGV